MNRRDMIGKFLSRNFKDSIGSDDKKKSEFDGMGLKANIDYEPEKGYEKKKIFRSYHINEDLREGEIDQNEIKIYQFPHDISELSAGFTISFEVRFQISSVIEQQQYCCFNIGIKEMTGVSSEEKKVIQAGISSKGYLFIEDMRSNTRISSDNLVKGLRIAASVFFIAAGGGFIKISCLDSSGNTLAVLRTDKYKREELEGAVSVNKVFNGENGISDTEMIITKPELKMLQK